MSKHRMAGFQKPTQPNSHKKVNVAFVKYEGTAAVCSCGSVFKASREKVLEDRIDRHLIKRHKGQGVRL